MLDPQASEADIEQHAAAIATLQVPSFLSACQRNFGYVHPALVDQFVSQQGGKPCGPAIGITGRIKRLSDRRWWARQLRIACLRVNENTTFIQGHIRRKRQVYVSDFAAYRVAARTKRNRDVLAKLEAVSDDGKTVNLLEASDASVSNPMLRRTELMTRCHGFEQIAELSGHVAVFVTATAPSRYHRFAGGVDNPKWCGDLPIAAHHSLMRAWAAARAKLQRLEIYPYGFRVVEPHHDGVPHWHMLLFVPADKVGYFVPRRFVADRADYGVGLLAVLGAAFCGTDTYELKSDGAQGARFNAKVMHAAHVEDTATGVRTPLGKGGATAYIAKYIAKNIDGFTGEQSSVGLDFDSGKNAIEASARVRAWASVKGIRQFQQIGGPSVTVWRQLRKLGKGVELQNELFEHPRAAADKGLWAMFWMLQGGAETRRGDLSLKPDYENNDVGKYGEPVTVVGGIKGYDEATMSVDYVRTRLHDWVVQKAGFAALAVQRYVASLPNVSLMPEWHEVERSRLIDAEREFERMDFSRSAPSAATWTGVNNCTVDSTKITKGSGDNLENEYTPWIKSAKKSPQCVTTPPTFTPIRS